MALVWKIKYRRHPVSHRTDAHTKSTWTRVYAVQSETDDLRLLSQSAWGSEHNSDGGGDLSCWTIRSSSLAVPFLSVMNAAFRATKSMIPTHQPLNFLQHFLINYRVHCYILSSLGKAANVTFRPDKLPVVKNTSKAHLMTSHSHTETCYVRKCTYSNKMPKMSPCWAMFIFLFSPLCVIFMGVRLLWWREGEQGRAEQSSLYIMMKQSTIKIKFMRFIFYTIPAVCQKKVYFWIIQNETAERVTVGE